MGIKERLKGLGGKAKGKAVSFGGKAKVLGGKAKKRLTFAQLYKKRGIKPPEDRPGKEGDEGKKEEKKSIFGGLGRALKGIGKKKCKACGSTDIEFYRDFEKYTSYKCKKCNAFSNFYKKKKKKPEETKPEEGPEKEKKKRLKLPETRGGNPPVLIGTIGLIGALWFLGFPMILIILGVILLVLVVLQFIFPPWFKWIVVGGMVGSAILFYQLGQFSDITAVIPPAYAEQIEEAYYETKDTFYSGIETTRCYMKMNPELVDACLEELEEKEEEYVKKIGKNKNLKLTYGREIDSTTLKNKKPDVNKIYNFNFMLKNENSEEYEIEIKNISVVAEGDEDEIPGDVKRLTPYTIQPQEDMQVRVEWMPGENPLPSCDDADNIDFLINITSIQKSGGGSSKYGLAPQEEGHVNYLHFFDPKIETNPGPLDIYVFTDPYAINLDPDWYKEFAVIIKIKNKVEGTAFLDNITLIQTFDDPWTYFRITECYDDEYNFYTLNSYTEGECGAVEYPVNCFTLDFTTRYKPNLNLTKDESKEIICTAEIRNRTKLTGTYTDLISVFTPSYEFLQEFKKTKIAECATPTTTSTTTPTTTQTKGGCLEEGSFILTPNGFERIEDLREGDYVIGYEDGKRVESKILEKSVHQGEFELYYYKGYWFTGNHLVYTDDYEEFKPVSELSNIKEYYEGKVYNIQTESENYFGENDLLIHNK